eukprot:4393146-Prorocentrum_lima.AAC.1
MSRTPSARHTSRHPFTPTRSMRREVENGRVEPDRSRSSSPSLRAGPGHSMLEEEIEVLTAGNNCSAQ